MTDTLSDRELDDIEARKRIFKPMGDASSCKDEGSAAVSHLELYSALPGTSPAKFQPYPAPRIERHQLLEVA